MPGTWKAVTRRQQLPTVTSVPAALPGPRPAPRRPPRGAEGGGTCPQRRPRTFSIRDQSSDPPLGDLQTLSTHESSSNESLGGTGLGRGPGRRGLPEPPTPTVAVCVGTATPVTALDPEASLPCTQHRAQGPEVELRPARLKLQPVALQG